MPFVQRDDGAAVIAVSQAKSGDCAELVSGNDPGLLQFLKQLRPNDHELARSDRDFIRVLEDLLDLLLEKELIGLAELPTDAQRKLAERKSLRDRLTRSLA